MMGDLSRPFPVCSVMAVCCILLACTGTPLDEYAAKNREEAIVLSLLMEYQDARAAFDLERYLACLHENGTYHHACRVMVSKTRLRQLLPQFWADLQTGDRKFFPMSRENLSGNYFVDFRLVDPKITLHRDRAAVTATYVNRGWRLKHYITMIRENGYWRINRLDWETG